MFERFIETDELKRLPFSSNRIWLSKNAQVIVDGKEVKPSLNKLGDLVIKLDWIEGYKEYYLAKLIAHVFKPLYLKIEWWNKIHVLFADGDKTNLHPINLVWKFPVGLGSDKYNGFAFVPMYSRYMINREGVLFDTVSNKIINWHFVKGYYSASLKPDIGPRTSLKRHRGLCLAFTDYPYNLDSLQVNHINGITGDDRLENLEWVTPSENRLHAIVNGLTLVNKPVLVTNLLTEEEVEYFSLVDCCQKLNLNEREVSVNLGHLNGTYTCKDFILKYKNPEHAFVGNANKCPILVKDLRTDIITRYDSIVSCSRSTGLTKDAIAGRIEKPTSNLYKDYLQIKRESDTTPWYDPEDYEQELLNNSWSKKILVKDLLTNKIVEYNSQREACSSLGISESTIVAWLNISNYPVLLHPKEKRYIQLKRKSDQSSWRKVDDPEKEYYLNSQSRGVVVKNVKTDEIVEYSSVNECARALNILPTTLHWRLKTQGQKLYPNGLQFKYKDCDKPFSKVDSLVLSLI